MSNQLLIQEATRKCLAKAGEMYDMDLSKVAIEFNLKGSSMGQACWRVRGLSGKPSALRVRFNLRMCSEDMNDAINDTVPHEVAHIVCGVNPKLGSKHDAGWREVCIALGGTGNTFHTQEVIYSKGKTYAYTTSNGRVLNLSELRHKKLQSGLTFRLKDGSTITKSSPCTVVGFRGQRITPAVLAPQAMAAKKSPNVDVPVAPTVTAPTVTAPTVAAPAAPKLKKESKAEQVRVVIRKCKAQDEDASVAVAFAIDILGMKAGMARRYVSENWDRA